MSTRREVIGTLILLPLGLSACRFGGWGRGFRESGLGCTVELRPAIGTQRTEGELLLARDDGLVVLSGGRVLFAPWDAMSRVTFQGVPVDRLLGGQAPTNPGHLDNMRQVSRYPYPLTDAQMDAVLERQGQAEMGLYP